METESRIIPDHDMKLKDLVLSFCSDVIRKKRYWMPVVFFAVLSYGFSMFNRTVSIDDLDRDYYTGSGHAMIAGTRWGMLLWSKLFSTSVNYTPFTDKFIGVLFLILSAALFCMILYFLNGRDSWIWQYTVFSSIMVTYPLINEIWEYNGANMFIFGNLSLTALSLLLQIKNNKLHVPSVIGAGLLMTLVVSTYESVAFAYIVSVFMILYLKYCVYGYALKKKYTWITEGLTYAVPLAAAVLLRFLIGFALIRIYGIEYRANGATEINWETGSVFYTLVHSVIISTVFYYFLRGLTYFPVGIFVCSVIVFTVWSFIRCIKRKSVLPALLGLLLMGSLFFQAVIQGAAMPYRTAQTLTVFVPFVCFTVISSPGLRSGKGRVFLYFRTTLTVLFLFLALRQGICLHTFLALNNQRSDNEAAVVQQIGYELYSKYDTDKVVVFVGGINLGDCIESQISISGDSLFSKLCYKLTGDPDFPEASGEFVINNVNSYTKWAKLALGGQSHIADYFSYYGYDIKTLASITSEEYNKYEQTAKENNMATYAIRDMGDYILVNLG